MRTEFTVLVPRVGNVVEFLRGENKGVFVDGKKMDGLLVPKEKECCVKVIY